MFQNVILIVALFFVAHTSSACSCTYSEKFNLLDYDSNELIFEVKIESKYDFKKDTTKTDIAPPPTLYEFGLVSGFNISLIEVFKGEIDSSIKIMDFPSSSSCSWTPEIGTTYIFYANSLGEIEMCNRKLSNQYRKENYLNEKSILQSLKKKPEKLRIASNEKKLIEGKYLNEQRDGIWKIYLTKPQNVAAISLTYSNGLLISIKQEGGFAEENKWLKMTYDYYLSQLNN